MNNSFYTKHELSKYNFKAIGQNVYIRKTCSIYKPEAISIGNNVLINDYCILAGGAGIRIGNHTTIECFSAFYAGSGISIGDYSTLNSRVSIYSESDDYSGKSLTNPMVSSHFKPIYHKGFVRLGKYCILGVSTSILPGVQIENGVETVTSSLITKNCKACTIYGGIPAKILKERKFNKKEVERAFLDRWEFLKKLK